MKRDENTKYYLYRHIRLDTNEPFYIGIGTKTDYYTNYETEYRRGHAKTNRSSFWERITNKIKYEIEIIIESNNKNFINQKEIEFIKLYGRKDKGVGPLVNLNDGGDGNNELRESLKIKVNSYTLSGQYLKTYESVTKAAKAYNITTSYVSAKCKNKKINGRKGITFRYYTDNIDNIKIFKKERKLYNAKAILQFDLNNNIINNFNSIEEAHRITGCCVDYIRNLCNNKNVKVNKYIFKFKN